MAEACNFIKKETQDQVFYCEFCKISKNTFSYRTTPVAASMLSFRNSEGRLFSAKFKSPFLEPSNRASLVLFFANFRTLVTRNCLTGWFFVENTIYNLMTFTFQWMSVAKAGASQISSEYFNGSGSRDLQQDRSEILRDGKEGRWGGHRSSKNWGLHLVPSIYWCYDPVQYYLRTKVSHKFDLHETIYSRRCEVMKYLISKVYKKGYNKSFFLQGIKFSTSERIFENYSLSHFAETYF